MQYPIWDVPQIGGGMVIAMIAIFHVTIAHFAVGAGLFSAVTEHYAWKKNNQLLLRFLRDYVRYLILISFVLGALSGVGIWFSISLVSPEATSALIHQYVWGWGTEWVFFILEIISGYIYYYTWDRLSTKKHVTIGWIYAISAYMSLVVINGIISFMLSPGEWLQTRSFWDGFFNPTYWPSLLLRTISSLSIAAIFVTIIANIAKGYTREERHQIIVTGGRWLIPLALMIPISIWFFANVPEAARDLVKGQAIAMTLFLMFGLTASTLVGFYAYFGLILRRRYINLETSVLLGLIAFIATGSMEFVREGIRKPYIIYEYMYSNGITMDEAEELDEKGVLDWAPWAAIAMNTEVSAMNQIERGEAIYRVQCTRCHTMEGFNGIKPLIKNWSENSIRHSLENLHEEQYFMPPFFGPEKDLQDITQYLLTLAQSDEMPQQQSNEKEEQS